MARQNRYAVREGVINGMDNMLRWFGNMDAADVRKLQRKGMTRGDIIFWWEFDLDSKTDEEIDEIISTYFEEVC